MQDKKLILWYHQNKNRPLFLCLHAENLPAHTPSSITRRPGFRLTNHSLTSRRWPECCSPYRLICGYKGVRHTIQLTPCYLTSFPISLNKSNFFIKTPFKLNIHDFQEKKHNLDTNFKWSPLPSKSKVRYVLDSVAMYLPAAAAISRCALLGAWLQDNNVTLHVFWPQYIYSLVWSVSLRPSQYLAPAYSSYTN